MGALPMVMFVGVAVLSVKSLLLHNVMGWRDVIGKYSINRITVCIGLFLAEEQLAFLLFERLDFPVHGLGSQFQVVDALLEHAQPLVAARQVVEK